MTSGSPTEPFEVFAASILDGLAGFLAAPASDLTLRRLRELGDENRPVLHLL